MKEKKIAVLVVTYNRKEYLYKLLGGLSKQTYEVDTLFLVDNNSTDNTAEFLKERNVISDFETGKVCSSVWENIKIQYFRNNENTGGSGGFKKAIEIMLDSQEVFDYVWVMDDDVLPAADCLSELLKNIEQEYRVVIPNRTTSTFVDRPIHSFNWKNPFRSIRMKKYGNPERNEDVCDMPFEGPLMDYELMKQVGLVDDRYFIFFDDSDYAQRCFKYTNIKFVSSAILNKQIIPNETTPEFSWKTYYLLRNEIVFDKKYNKNKILPYIRSFMLLMKNILLAIISIDWTRAKYAVKAFKDGHAENMGKTVEPGKF